MHFSTFENFHGITLALSLFESLNIYDSVLSLDGIPHVIREVAWALYI